MQECQQCGKGFDPSLGSGDFCTDCADAIREELGLQGHLRRVKIWFRSLRIWRAVNEPPKPDPRYCGVHGWLLVSVVYLMILYPLGLALALPEWHATRTDSALSTVFPGALWVLFAERSFLILHGALGFYVGLSLWRIWPGAVPLAKFYVILFVGNALAVPVSLWFFESQTGVAHRWLLLTAAEVVLGAICYLYLRKSKRVVSTYRSGPR
jgi:hypothetical protein